jgi:hypothetical protein
MIGTRNIAVGSAEADAPQLRAEEPRTDMAEREEAIDAVRWIEGDAYQPAINLRFAELGREGQRAVQQDIEVIGSVGELPEILSAKGETVDSCLET